MNMSNIKFYVWGAILLSLAAILAMLITGTRPARADGYHCWDIDGCPRHHHHVTHHRRSVVEVNRYYREPEDLPPAWDERDHGRCLPTKVEIVSTEHNTEDAARESAKKLWMVQTAWRFGGQFIDLENAVEVREKCGPSNPMDTITGRLIEGVQKLSGSEGQNVRCEIVARPCTAPLKRVGKEDWDTGMKR